jgi:hypothetical protein
METTARHLRHAILRHCIVAILSALVALTLFVNALRLRHGPSTGTLVVAGIAYYHFRQCCGKTRRYFNQRHRAANELLRADFRRHA